VIVSIVSEHLPIGHPRLEQADALEHVGERTILAQPRQSRVELADEILDIGPLAGHREMPGRGQRSFYQHGPT
jgi:hypothetical protein